MRGGDEERRVQRVPAGQPEGDVRGPSVMLSPNSSRIRLIVSSVVTTACGSAPTVIASGSMTMSSSGIS